MRVLVYGGRHFGAIPDPILDNIELERAIILRDKQCRLFQDTMNTFHKEHNISVLCNGGAKGADTLATKWATTNNIQLEVYPVTKSDWYNYGKFAGIRRNGIIFNKFLPDVVMAFSGGRGTENMISIATDAGVKVIEVH